MLPKNGRVKLTMANTANAPNMANTAKTPKKLTFAKAKNRKNLDPKGLDQDLEEKYCQELNLGNRRR